MFFKIHKEKSNLVAFIADIHANLEALNAVLKRIRKLGIKRVICLGDLVGYNANPNECVDVIRKHKIMSIMGNHDAVACGLEEPDHFNHIAKEAILWTRNKLSEENKKYLKGLSDSYVLLDNFVITHGSLFDRDEYIFSNNTAHKNISIMEKQDDLGRLCFFGHTHVKSFFPSNGTGKIIKNGKYTLELRDEEYYLVNPGSVGQPRDEDTRAAFAVFDRNEMTVKYELVEYDIEITASKIRKAGLPVRLAERLMIGK